MKKLLIIDCGSIHVPKIQEMSHGFFEDVVTKPLSIFCREKMSEKDLSFDLIIFSGSSQGLGILYGEENYPPLFSFLQKTTLPVLGICFGCELIARAYGSTLKDTGEKTKGEETICFKDGKNLCLDVYEAHRFCVDKPAAVFDVLATGTSGSIEIIKHKDKPLLGVQFHPEVSTLSSEIFLFCLKELRIK